MPSYNAAWRFLLAGFVVFGSQIPAAFPFAGPQCSPRRNTCFPSSTLVKSRRSSSCRNSIGSVTYASRSGIQSNASNGNESELDDIGNIVWLQDRFELTDEWSLKTAHQSRNKQVDTLDRAIISDRLEFLQNRLKLSAEELKSIVRKYPGLLLYQSDENVGPTLHFLSDRLGVGKKALAKIVKDCPTLLGSKQETLQRNLDYIESRICLNEAEKVATVVKKCPKLLSLSIDENLEPTVIKFQNYFGFDDAEVSAVFMKFPNLLSLDFDKSIKARIEWFRETLHANVKEISKIVKKQPTLLASSVNLLESKHLWLKKRLEVDDKTLKKIVLKMPSILCCSQEDNLEPTIQWFERRFAITAKQVGIMMGICPSLLVCSICENLEPTLVFYTRNVLGTRLLEQC